MAVYSTNSPTKIVLRRAMVCAAVIVLGLGPGLTAPAQVRPKNQPKDLEEAIIPQSAPVDDLFSRARDGIARGDWKFVVDSLQRIIDDPQGALVDAGDAVYVTVRHSAYSQLAKLPPEGLSSYHLLYDAEACALYEAAVADHDVVKLRHVVHHYMLTECGDRAASLLATWMLEARRPASAVAALRMIGALRPDSPLNDTVVPAKLAMAYAMMGWPALARTYLPAADAELSDAWRQRFATIETALHGFKGITHETPTAWPMAYGGGARRGIMPATDPAFVEGLPWRYELPLSFAPSWSTMLENHSEHMLLPLNTILAIDDMLLTQADGRVVAIDALTFEQLWVSEPPAAALAYQRPQNPNLRRADVDVAESERRAEQDAAAKLLIDDLGAQITVAHDLAFTLIAGEPENPARTRVVRNRQLLQRRHHLPDLLSAQRLDADGEVAWTLGRDGDHPLPSPAGLFAAAPVAAGDEILVPFWQNKDLYVGLIDPQDGHVIESTHLCTTPTPAWRFSLAPAVHEHMAFIPTNGGLIFGYDIPERQVVWAARYRRAKYDPIQPEMLWDRLESNAAVARRTIQWLPGPPVISGAAVVCAPSDADELIALDRASGKRLWATDRGVLAYIIGADDQHMWLGGGETVMIATATGQRVWARKLPPTTGRAVISGDQLMFPTIDGLLVVDARTGQEVVEHPLPHDTPPLGNLLCWGGALYSIDSQYLRKFPDLERSYAVARDMFERRPNSLADAQRLAWMELLRDAPSRSLDVLAMIDVTRGSAREQSQLNRLRVAALVASAKELALPAAERERRLLEALDIARAQRDVFTASTALSTYYEAAGQSVAAFEVLWKLLMSTDGDELTTVGSGVYRSVRRAIVEDASRLITAMGSADVSMLVGRLRPAMLDAGPSDKRNHEVWVQLDRLADAPSLAGWRQAAALKLGTWAVQLREYEKAEYYLNRVVLMNDDPALSAAALDTLVRMYLRNDLALVHLADRAIKRLESEFSDRQINGRPVAEVAKQLARQSGELSWVAPERLPLNNVTNSNTTFEMANLLTLPRDQHHTEDVMIMLSAPRRLVARRVSDGRLMWDASLRLLGQRDDEPSVLAALDVTCRAKLDGQTMLVNTTEALWAVGVVTGRRLWYREFDSPLPRPGTGSSFFDAAQGRVALRRGGRHIEVLRNVSPVRGGTGDLSPVMLWEGRIAEFRVGEVRIIGDRVVAISDSAQEAIVFDADNGRRIFEWRFDHLPNRRTLAIVGDTLCGVDKQRNIVVLDLADGSERGRVPLRGTEPLAMIKSIGAQDVLVSSEDHTLVLDVASLVPLFDGHFETITRGVRGGLREDERVLLWGLSGKELQNMRMHFVALDGITGEVLWTHGDALVPIGGAPELNLLPDAIPLVFQRTGPANRARQNTGSVNPWITLLDKTTGQMSRARNLIPESSRTVLSGEVEWTTRGLILGSDRGVLLFPYIE